MSTNSTRSSGSASGIISVPAFNQMVTVKLTGENLLLWTMQLFPYLRSQKLMGYIDGTRESPLPTITEGEGGDDARSVANPVFEQWYQQDQLVLSAMLSSLGDTVLAQVVGCTSAHEVWRVIEPTFATASRAQIMQIRMQLATIQKKDLTINHRVLPQSEEPRRHPSRAVIGKPLENDEVIAYILQGLPAEYDAIVTSITTCTDINTPSDALAHLLSYELRVEHNNGGGSQANQVNRTSSGNTGGAAAMAEAAAMEAAATTATLVKDIRYLSIYVGATTMMLQGATIDLIRTTSPTTPRSLLQPPPTTATLSFQTGMQIQELQIISPMILNACPPRSAMLD